jgi:hypothetical protein
MKTRRFNREAAREDYLKSYPQLKRNKARLELLLVRGELLARNPLFIKELEEWEEAEAHHKDEEWKEDRYFAFMRRWHVDPYDGFLFTTPLQEPAVQELGANREKVTVTLQIDLRYSKRKILAAIDNIIDDWQENLREEVSSALSSRDAGKVPSWFNEGDTFDNVPMLQTVKERKTNKDHKDYLKALEAWDLHEAGKSWSAIQKELKLNNLQAGRNWKKKADELIKKGVPTLPAFPQK